MKVKVLTCPSALNLSGEWAFVKNRYITSHKLFLTEPVFNRPGFYMDRTSGKCWIETNNGEAYEGESLTKEHRERLEESDTPALSWLERKAVETLQKGGLCPQPLSTLYRKDSAMQESRTYRLRLRKRAESRTSPSG